MNIHVPLVDKLPDGDWFGVEQLTEASMQAERDPASLTDRQLGMIACYDRDGAQTAARKRAEARAKAAAPPVAPSRPTSPVARHVELARLTKADDLSTHEGFEAWHSKNSNKAAPVWMFKAFFGTFTKTIKAQREKNDDLEIRVRRLESMLVLQTNHIKNLQSNTTTRGAQWGGEHEVGKGYSQGEFVRFQQGVWVALRDCDTTPGSRLGDWDLVIPGSAQP